MTNRSVIHWLSGPTEIEEDHEHEMIFAQHVCYKSPNSMRSSDLSQLFEQCGPDAKRMIFMGDDYRDFSSFRIVADAVVRYTDQPADVECAERISPMCRLGQVANDFVKLDWPQREESV